MMNNISELEMFLVSNLTKVLLTSMAFVSVLSWGMASLGLPVESLLSEEAICWLFSERSVSIIAPALQWLLLAAVTAGAVLYSGLLSGSKKNRTALWSALATWLILLALLALLILIPAGPLRSVTGHLILTPYLGGIFRALALSVILAAAVYGGVSGKLRTWSQYVTLLFFGIQRFAPLVILILMTIMLFQIILYAFG
ncbi:MAG: AbgT family transporter [Bacteroidaceae bacterium]|nr:AbgT family transporter [Bacteroidaceae bacterium]